LRNLSKSALYTELGPSTARLGEMKEIGPASEDEMISAFLRAEIDSSRYGNTVNMLSAEHQRSRALIESSNFRDFAENAARKAILARYRGYPNQLLFAGFPADAIWRRVEFDPVDLATLRYANTGPGSVLDCLSGGSYRVTEGARRFTEDPSVAADMPIGAVLRR
jgi:hypothetical protein